MQRLILSIILFSTLCCMPKDLPTVANLQDKLIEVKFSHLTTKSEIEKIAQDLNSKYGITLVFNNSTFFEDGKLRDLKLGVDMGSSGAKGSCSANLTTLQYKYYGFKISLQNQGNSPFHIGVME